MSMKKLLLLLLPIILVISGCGEKAAESVTTGQRYYSLVQGFEYLPSRQNPVGYITYLKIGDVEVAADLTVTDPLNPLLPKIKVSGVVSWLTWKGGPNDPVVFAAQVSKANKDTLTALGKTNLADKPVEFSFALYDNDIKFLMYYKSMSSGTGTLKGTLFKQGDNLLYLISGDSGVDVTSPENFNFQLGVKAAGGGQKIVTVESFKIVEKPWGGE
jgi:hypothetical protein